jgi:hypothetical protein
MGALSEVFLSAEQVIEIDYLYIQQGAKSDAE